MALSRVQPHSNTKNRRATTQSVGQAILQHLTLKFLPEGTAAHHRMMQQRKFRALLKWIDHGREEQRALQRLRNGIIQWMFGNTSTFFHIWRELSADSRYQGELQQRVMCVTIHDGARSDQHPCSAADTLAPLRGKRSGFGSARVLKLPATLMLQTMRFVIGSECIARRHCKVGSNS